ncbi:MAG: HRDC domain-containing protein [Nitrospirota bacterium]
MAVCGSSCDACAGLDPVGVAPPIATKRTSFGVRAPSEEPPTSAGSPLFSKLKALRKKLADARRVPAYMVFNDATLMEMASRLPKNEEEMRAVSGVGPKKWVEYGEIFLAGLREG